MKYIHVRNLEKYQSGYRDRNSHWVKIYTSMVQGNHESEMLSEIDFARLVKLIVLETESKRPTPASEAYLSRKGFDFGLKSLLTSLKELDHFIELVEENHTQVVETTYVTDGQTNVQNPLHRVEENRRDKKESIYSSFFQEIWNQYPNKAGKTKAYERFCFSVKTEGDLAGIREAISRYRQHLQVNTWKQAQDGKTWFNSWRDWVEYVEPERRENAEKSGVEKLRELRAKGVS